METVYCKRPLGRGRKTIAGEKGATVEERAAVEREEVRLFRIEPDVVERTALGRSTIYEEIAAGRLRAVKIGRAVRVRSDDLAAWIESRTGDRPAA